MLIRSERHKLSSLSVMHFLVNKEFRQYEIFENIFFVVASKLQIHCFANESWK